MEPGNEMTELRTSQRVPLRCTECARRRVKCDKRVPCSRCIANRSAHLCVREIVRVRGKPTVAAPIENANASLAQQNSELQERVAELELALMMSMQGRAWTQPPPIDASASKNKRALTGSPPQVIPLEEVGAILDEWNLGLPKHEDLGNLTSKKDMHYLVETLKSVPDKQTSTRIVEYSLQMFGWIHCALRVDQFLAEHEAFQSALLHGTLEGLQDHKWMAIYFSVLAVGLFFMDDEDMLALNLPMVELNSYPFSVSHHWYRAACLQLAYSDAMGKPQLHVVQVAAILTLCHPHFGQSYRDHNLSSLARSAAYALQMHRLGSEDSHVKSLERIPEWSDEAGREHGRRLWWTLVICDWLGGPRSPISLSADSFDCVLEIGRFDYNLILGGTPLSDGVVVFSPLLHHIELSKLAQVLREYVQNSTKSPATLCQFLKRLDELQDNFITKTDRLSASFRDGVNQGLPMPVWVSGQQSHYLCTVNLIRLVLCRVLLQQSFVQLPAWSEIRGHGMRAALDIVRMDNVPSTYQLLWVFGSSTIAAGVFLCLDLLTSPHHKTETELREQRHSIQLCIITLERYSYKTPICREGSKILRRLSALELAQESRPIGQADLTRMIKTMARPAEDGSSQQNLTSDQGPSLWPEFIGGQSSNTVIDNDSFASIVESPSMAGIMMGDGQPDADWLMDSIMFPGY